MKKNIGTQESNLRMLAGSLIILFALFIVTQPYARIILATLAAILAGTAFLRFCPINILLKRDTSDPEDNVEEVTDEPEEETFEEPEDEDGDASEVNDEDDSSDDEEPEEER